MWKGLTMLGSMFSIKKDKPKYLTREEQKRIRASFNKINLCDECLFEYQHQTKDGTMLCDICYQERKSNDVQ